MNRQTLTQQQLSFTELSQSVPALSREELLAGLVPPPHFADVSFATYQPDASFPSQAQARARLAELGEQLAKTKPTSRFFSAKRKVAPSHVYLDGGFGVGKTHLLVSLAGAVGERAAYGSFVEYTAIVGVLGFSQTVASLASYQLVCIDEFELDDPGDTLIMSRLIRELSEHGVSVVVTSNTLPESLGEGRFSHHDFLREIQALADRFEVIHIDGPDYRNADRQSEPVIRTAPQAGELEGGASSGKVAFATTAELLAALKLVHPSRYRRLVGGLGRLVVTEFEAITDEHAALRFVALVDRLYDNEVAVTLSAAGGDQNIFTPEMLRGGYRKKYFRALSRLSSLTNLN